MKECFIKSLQVFEHGLEEEDSEASDRSDEAYVGCIEEQWENCRYPIMRHLLQQAEAFKKDLKQLEILEAEEQQELEI